MNSPGWSEAEPGVGCSNDRSPEGANKTACHGGLPPALRAELLRRMPVCPGVDLPRMLDAPNYLARVCAVADERHGVGDDAPTLLMAPWPIDRDRAASLLGGRPVLGLIFGAESVLFQDTVHAMHVDGMAGGDVENGFAVLGVHHEWLLPGGRAGRALAVDDDGRVKDMVFAEPVRLSAAMTLHLPLAGEHDLHRRCSEWCVRTGVQDLNPYASARRADSKALAHGMWAELIPQVRAPTFLLVQRNTPRCVIEERLGEFLRRMAANGRQAAYVQPNGGTEGSGAVRCTDRRGTLAAVGTVLHHDDAIVREERGGLRYRAPDEPDKGYRRACFRVNVAWDGTQYVAESGFVQVAPDENAAVASRGQGGVILAVRDVLAHLYRRRGSVWVHVVPLAAEVEELRRAACMAAQALCGGPGADGRIHLLGIDLLLEYAEEGETDGVHPVLLEANPRPAGLAQSSSLGPIHSTPARHTVSHSLLRGVSQSNSQRRT